MMQEIVSKNVFKGFNKKDLTRIICSLTIVSQSMLLIVDCSFEIIKETSENILYLKFLANYFCSALFLLFGLLVFIGKKTKLKIYLTFILLFVTLSLIRQNKGINYSDIVTSTTIVIFGIIVLMNGAGNVTVDKLFDK